MINVIYLQVATPPPSNHRDHNIIIKQ